MKKQAEDYVVSPQSWYALWFENLIPLVYMANGNKIYFKNMLVSDSEYEELYQMYSPKKMLQIVDEKSEYGHFHYWKNEDYVIVSIKRKLNLKNH